MLCPFCEGTEHSPRPDGMLRRAAGQTLELRDCVTCGSHLWESCTACAGEGRKLHVYGQCHRCGNSILYWLPCQDCKGAGKVYRPSHACIPERAPQSTRINPVILPPSQPSVGPAPSRSA